MFVLALSCLACSPGGNNPIVSKTSPEPFFAPLEGPWVVAVQPGHWKVEELPEELSRLRTSTGAVFGEVREVDVNLRVADHLLKRIESRG